MWVLVFLLYYFNGSTEEYVYQRVSTEATCMEIKAELSKHLEYLDTEMFCLPAKYYPEKP